MWNCEERKRERKKKAMTNLKLKTTGKTTKSELELHSQCCVISVIQKQFALLKKGYKHWLSKDTSKSYSDRSWALTDWHLFYTFLLCLVPFTTRASSPIHRLCKWPQFCKWIFTIYDEWKNLFLLQFPASFKQTKSSLICKGD